MSRARSEGHFSAQRTCHRLSGRFRVLVLCWFSRGRGGRDVERPHPSCAVDQGRGGVLGSWYEQGEFGRLLAIVTPVALQRRRKFAC